MHPELRRLLALDYQRSVAEHAARASRPAHRRAAGAPRHSTRGRLLIALRHSTS